MVVGLLLLLYLRVCESREKGVSGRVAHVRGREEGVYITWACVHVLAVQQETGSNQTRLSFSGYGVWRIDAPNRGRGGVGAIG